MSKKLKKKIAEICGLKDLDTWEARQARATQILESTEWKQSICNELIGLSFRELEQYLSGVASERQKKEEAYEHKLQAYKSGKRDRRPKAGRQAGPTSEHHSQSASTVAQSGKARPRTLKEILAQVYAPRVCEGGLSHQHAFQFRDGQPETQSADEVLPDSTDGNGLPDESVG